MINVQEEISKGDIKAELERINKKSAVYKNLKKIIISFVFAAAVAMLISSYVFSVFRVTGTSMTPTLESGQVIISVKSDNFKCGDLVAFYYNNKILVKRVIALSGQTVDIDDNGNVFVDGKQLDEDYIKAKSKGECDIELPYQVPDGKIFVMGDDRETSIDSRRSEIGAISDEQIAGKVVFRLFPFKEISKF